MTEANVRTWITLMLMSFARARSSGVNACRSRDRVVHDVPVAEYSENLRRTHAGMQRVFARRDSAIRPGQSAQNLEAPLAGDQALMFQHGGQLAERRPFRHHDDPDRRRL